MEIRLNDWRIFLKFGIARKGNSENSIYWHEVIVDTVTGHGVFTESLEVDRGAIKGVVVGVSKHQTGPGFWGKKE